jgi:hypothetical protein
VVIVLILRHSTRFPSHLRRHVMLRLLHILLLFIYGIKSQTIFSSLGSLGSTSRASYASMRSQSSYSMGSFRSAGNSIKDKVVEILNMGSGCSGTDLQTLYPLEQSISGALLCNPRRPLADFQDCVEQMFPDAELSSQCIGCIGTFVENLLPSCWSRVQAGTFSRSRCVEIITNRLQRACLP